MTANVHYSRHPADVDDVRLHVFVAQSLAVRPLTAAEFDEVQTTIDSVRGALDEIEVLVPSLDEAVGRELREGCALLDAALEIVASRGDGGLSRSTRRRLAALNAAGVEHVARALDRLDDEGRVPASVPSIESNWCSPV